MAAPESSNKVTQRRNSWLWVTFPYIYQWLCETKAAWLHDGVHQCTHAEWIHTRGNYLQRVPLSSSPSCDINIWANAVRQPQVENPQKSLAITAWECSSEGHALCGDYKQHRKRSHDRTICLILWFVFLKCIIQMLQILGLFRANASSCG